MTDDEERGPAREDEGDPSPAEPVRGTHAADDDEPGLTLTSEGAPATVAGKRAGPGSAPPDPMLGRRLGGRYEVVAEVGAGGMGRVYKARDLSLRGRAVAVKVLPPEVNAPGLHQRFADEIHAMAQLPHCHNLLAATDAGEDAGVPFVVMRYLEGETLEAAIRRLSGLDYPEALRILKQIARGVAVAHDAGMIHRDLKPSNIFLEDVAGSDEPTAVVIDLGVARLVGERTDTLTRRGAVVGTPEYIPPEYLRPGEVAPHPRIDVYALGLIAYEMVTGRFVFRGKTGSVILALKERGEPKEALHAVPGLDDVPPAFSRVVARALAADPEARFQDASELVAALEQLDAANVEELPPGLVLHGRYEIVRPISAGGMGMVYEVIDRHRHDRAALKVFLPEDDRQEYRNRFERECDLLIELARQHPNIVNIRSRDRVRDRPYYVMDYVDGAPLDEARLSWDELLDALDGVGSALDFVHARDVVHRDIKPTNILIERKTKHAYLIDFGIARIAGSQWTTAGLHLGTQGFLAPELLTLEDDGGSHRAVPASDQWALGATVFALLTGRAPPESPDAIAELGALRPQLATIAPPLLPALALALAPEPEARFPTVGAFVQALAATRGQPIGLARPQDATATRNGRAAGGSTAPGAPTPAPTETPMAGSRTSTTGGTDDVRPGVRAVWPVAAAALLVLAGVGTWYAARGTSRLALTPAAPARTEEPTVVEQPVATVVEDAAPPAEPTTVELTITTLLDDEPLAAVALRVGGELAESPVALAREPGAHVTVEVVDRRFRSHTEECVVQSTATRCDVALRNQGTGKRRPSGKGVKPSTEKPSGPAIRIDVACDREGDCADGQRCVAGRCTR